MRYYKTEVAYFASPREVLVAEEITREQYEAFLAAVSQKPEVPEGHGCRLTDSLEWEVYPLPDMGEPDPDLSDGEILDILLGGAL